MGKYGFKEISRENWLIKDEVLNLFGGLNESGEIQDLTSEDLLNEILLPVLDDKVPEEVRTLFEVARASMCYGYFFYPLFTLAAEQLNRVAEAAVLYKCKQENAPKKFKSFYSRIDYLINKGLIPKSEKIRWQGIRGLRNISSHPSHQSIIPPGNAIKSLKNMAKCINDLYIGT